MKGIILSFCLMVFTSMVALSQTSEDVARIDSVCQYNSHSEEAGHFVFDYKDTPEWRKYKVLTVVGWSSLGIGLPATFCGFALCIGSSFGGSKGFAIAGAVISLFGVALTVASIPLLCSGYHSRNKAKKMSLNIGVSQISTTDFCYKQDGIPAINFALSF